MKRMIALLLAAWMIISLAACAQEPSPTVAQPTELEETKGEMPRLGELMILFTGGLDGVYAGNKTQGSVGYAALAAYAEVLREDYENVLLVDGGGSVKPDAPEELLDVVDACGYDIRVPGELELSGSVKNLTELAQDRGYISCNLMDLTDNTTVFDPYVILEFENLKVGFVGVTKPMNLEDPNYEILGVDDGQVLRDAVQEAVDAAADEGAEYVIVVGNLGTDPEDSPCTTPEVIAGITGFVAWLDCGSGAVLDGDTVADKDDFEIPLCAPGSGFSHVGQITVDLNTGVAHVKLQTEFDDEDRSVLNLIDQLEEE